MLKHSRYQFLILALILSSIPNVQGQDGSLGVEDISFDIEGGNGENLKQIGKNKFRFDVEYDTGSTSLCYWFKFRILQAAAGQRVTFNARLPGDPFFSYGWLKPVYSYDEVNWYYIENRVYESGVLQFTESFTEDQVTIAVAFPYSLSELEDYIASIESLPYVETNVLGYSDENRPIHLVKVTDPTVPDNQKKHILLVGGQHAGETHGMLVVKGMIEYLVSSPEMRSRYVYHIVPLVNVDGVNAGNTRLDTNGVDLNREWADEIKEPEIQCVYNYLASNSFDLVIDSHTQESGYPYFGLTPSSSYYQESLELWASVAPYTYYDRTLDGSELSGSLRWEAYDDFGFFSIAIEHSQTNYAWSYIEYVSEGHGLVLGINEYFGVPQPQVHDVAVTSMNTPSSIILGETVPIEVITENQGAFSETYQVNCLDETESYVIGTETVTLEPGEYSSIDFTWDTTGAQTGEHIITSTVEPVPNESDTNDNTISRSLTVETPLTDLAISYIQAPSSAEQGALVAIQVALENFGNQLVTQDITITLEDETSLSLIGTQIISETLLPGADVIVEFTWDTGEAQFGEHILSASHDYEDDNAENDQLTHIISLTQPSNSIHVSDIDANTELKGKSGRWEVFIKITVSDNNENPVSNVLVSGVFSGDVSGPISVTSGSDGTVTFSTGNLRSGNSVTFTVNDLSYEPLSYEPLDNHDSDNDSDGTSITVNKP